MIESVRTARHLAKLHNEPGVSTQMVNLLGINTSLLSEVQDDLLNRWAASKRQTKAWVHTGPLKRYYKSPAQDIFVRLHQLLFHLELLPLSTWGGRDDFSEPRPAWLKHAASVGRKRTVGTLSRLGLNLFLLQHEHRVPANATYLGVDVATQYLPIFSG